MDPSRQPKVIKYILDHCVEIAPYPEPSTGVKSTFIVVENRFDILISGKHEGSDDEPDKKKKKNK